jgi:DNA polymerase-3 subunit epsilon
MCRETADIDFERSGSDLLALLMETAAIKKHFPRYNRAQKNIRPTYGLFSFTDQHGIRHLAINRLRKGQQSGRVFYSQTEARLFLERLCTEHGLCARYCHLQEGVSECSHFRVPKCNGICRGSQTPEAYNSKVRKALDALEEGPGHLLISEKGRDPEEFALISIEKGVYRGYGFVPKDQCLTNYEEVEAFIIPQPAYPEMDRILQSYLLKHPDRVRNLEIS